MDSLKLAQFLFDRVQESIDCKQYISAIEVNYAHEESFGNEYIAISYTVKANEAYEALSYGEQQQFFQKTRKYIYSLSTHKVRFRSERKILRILEFRSIYESLAAYVLLQFEKFLTPDIVVKVKGVDLWSEANYAEMFIIQQSQRSPGASYGFERCVSQWDRLHELAKTSESVYKKEKKHFTITDNEIKRVFQLELNSIHAILLNGGVPIHITGVKTIDEVKIHTSKFVAELKRWTETRVMVNYLYEHYLPIEKIQFLAALKSEFLKSFLIQHGDILQLCDERIVMADRVSLNEEGEVLVEYLMLKTNLQQGERKRIIGLRDIAAVLKRERFVEFTKEGPVQRLSVLAKWMAKKKIPVVFEKFEPDLMKDFVSLKG